MKPQPNADDGSHFGSSSVGPEGRSGRLSNGRRAPLEPLCLISKALGLLHTIACSAQIATMASNPQEISSGEDDTNLTHSAGLAIGRRFLRAKAGSKAKAKGKAEAKSEAVASSSSMVTRMAQAFRAQATAEAEIPATEGTPASAEKQQREGKARRERKTVEAAESYAEAVKRVRDAIS